MRTLNVHEFLERWRKTAPVFVEQQLTAFVERQQLGTVRRTKPVRARPPDSLLTFAEAARKRATSIEAAAILGIKPRKLQAMSQLGEIPGAAKIKRQWTYDLMKLRGYVEQQEQATRCQNEKPRPDVTGAAESYGPKFRLKASGSGGRLGQMIRQSQRRVGKRAKKER